MASSCATAVTAGSVVGKKAASASAWAATLVTRRVAACAGAPVDAVAGGGGLANAVGAPVKDAGGGRAVLLGSIACPGVDMSGSSCVPPFL